MDVASFADIEAKIQRPQAHPLRLEVWSLEAMSKGEPALVWRP